MEIDMNKKRKKMKRRRVENEDKKQEKSYINLPMNKEEYEKFCNELSKCRSCYITWFWKKGNFWRLYACWNNGKKGIDTLRFGPLKPVGFDDPRYAKRPYAIVQLRQDNTARNNIQYGRVSNKFKIWRAKTSIFSMIPGLENAEFVKYGVMHRNTFINSNKIIR